MKPCQSRTGVNSHKLILKHDIKSPWPECSFFRQKFHKLLEIENSVMN